MRMTTHGTSTERSNRLVHEKSPYLRQHAQNPVDWFPWGPEALALAKRKNRPIFLSIGYATCHWCHVMERESFEDAETAALMNSHFVNIKVDREERPDLDAYYMAATQSVSGQGGWPMSVWLTPDGQPFYAGTYFPPDDRYGRPGFRTVLTRLAHTWERDRAHVAEVAGELAAHLAGVLSPVGVNTNEAVSPAAAQAACASALAGMADPVHGGFGRAPKFPMPAYHTFLLHHHARTGDPRALEVVSQGLRQMLRGGIHDHVGGGFARYATDAAWVVPHFEKMLTDNAQMLALLTDAWRATHEHAFAAGARGAADYLLRDLGHPDGGFFCAEDADSGGREGAYYAWTLEEVMRTLGDDGALFAAYYGVTANGNFSDPHDPAPGWNVLHVTQTVREMAQRFGKEEVDVCRHLKAARGRLFAERSRRPRPLRDEKILTGWNGLAIGALARAGAAFGEPRYLQAADGAARFLRQHLFDEGSGTLFRRWADGERKYDAHHTDYAYLICGLLDLFEASGDSGWLSWAVTLARRQDTLFEDGSNGGYFATADTPDLPFRLREDHDNVLPSGSGVAATNGLRLASITGDETHARAAHRAIHAHGGRFLEEPAASPTLTRALDGDATGHVTVAVVGPREREDTEALLRVAWETFLPIAAVIPVETRSPTRERLSDVAPWTGRLALVDGRATAYLCRSGTCGVPLTDPAALTERLRVSHR